MSTSKHTFMDIFNAVFSDGQESIRLQKIIIPIIQRDYAQGRKDPEIERVRKRFLDALFKAVRERPITLDFVYGDISEDGIMTPLDGQQRLTTLFLLHWYAAKREHVSGEEAEFLQRFGYETRHSARDFCGQLAAFSPSFSGRISEEIIDQPWFPLEWKKDPTISSMLVMIDAIHEKFSGMEGLWDRLKDGAVTFYFLPIRDMGLTDELYIKMNSRGKPLTIFEHFKAELERTIRDLDEETAERIIRKIDIDWTDMLWRYRDSGSGTSDDLVTDDEFLRYFRFICDVICYKSGSSPQGKSRDEFELLAEWFSGDREKVLKNISLMEAYFDCWKQIDGYSDPSEFLGSVMSHTYETGKITVENRYKIDIFGDCLHAYTGKGGRTREFRLNRIVLLYAVVIYLCSRDKVRKEDFPKRLRTVYNLIRNSDNELTDRSGSNRIPAILRQTDSIILTGNVDETIENSFNANQLAEEGEKQLYISQHPEQAEKLCRLEDHPYLQGQIGIVGIENIGLADRFLSLFTCSRDRIDCALMSVGNYGQRERNGWRYQYASKGIDSAWMELFHRGANTGFEKTKELPV